MKKILKKNGLTTITFWKNRAFLLRRNIIYEADLSFVSQVV